jgi:hypothetical protein
VGAREVVLAGAAEHDAGARLGSGALEPEVADAADALGLVWAGLRDLGHPGLQVDVVQRALRQARLPSALGRVRRGGAADRRAQRDAVLHGGLLPRLRVQGQVLGVREALAPLLRPPPRAASLHVMHGGGDRRFLAFVHHRHQGNLRNQFRKRKGVTQIAPARSPDTSKLGRKQTRNAESAH